MYKKQEKKFLYLLDQMLLLYEDPIKNHLHISSLNGQILDMLWGNKGLLPVSVQEKIIKTLSTAHEEVLLKALAGKEYQRWSREIVKLLDSREPHFSENIIDTLYKMGSYEYVEEIRPFAVLSMDDKMPFSQMTYREGLGLYDRFYAKFPPDENSSFRYLNDQAKKYIKKAEKLREEHKI